jgi:hypothetical protein
MDYSIFLIAKPKFRIGDKVKVVGMSPVTYPPGVKDELGTEKLFKSMLGKAYTVRGFDEYGNVELEPKRLNTVWVEPELLKLRARKSKKRKRRWNFSSDGLMHSLVLKYRSGEEIRKGDHVLFHGSPAEVEFVACDPNDPEAAWHMKEYGGGVLVSDPMVSGRTFIPKDQLDEYEDLEFVSRATTPKSWVTAFASTWIRRERELVTIASGNVSWTVLLMQDLLWEKNNLDGPKKCEALHGTASPSLNMIPREQQCR